MLLPLDAATGSPIWKQPAIISDSNRTVLLGSPVVDGAGSIFVAANYSSPYPENGRDLYVSRFDQSGNMNWRQKVGQDAYAWGGSLNVDGNGNVTVVADSRVGTGSTPSTRLAGLQSGVPYQFRIAGINQAGIGSFATLNATVTPKAAVPAQPQPPTATAGSSRPSPMLMGQRSLTMRSSIAMKAPAS